MKPQPGLKKQISRESLGDLVVSFWRTHCYLRVDISFDIPGTGDAVDPLCATGNCQ